MKHKPWIFFLLKFIKVVVVSVVELSSLIIEPQLSSPAASPLGGQRCY